MRRALAAALIALVASAARAEPYLAARTGLSCGACHLNRTGGGGRTAYGAGYGARSLPWKKLIAGHELVDGAIGERIRLGFDGRGSYAATFRDPGPYIGEAKISEASLYLGVELVKDTLSIYVDESIAPGGASAREAVAIYAAPWAGLYAKAGKFFLPFGLRLQDDEAATRRGTGFTLDSSDVGAEVGFDDGRWTSALSITNGTSGGAESDNDKQIVWSGARVWTLGRLGLSASNNDLPEAAHRTVAGAFGTFNAGPVVVLAEADVLRDDDGVHPETRGGAGHIEIDAAAHDGLNLRAFAGAYDLDRDNGVGRLSQWGVAADWTPLPGLQVRATYRNRRGPASVPGSDDDQAALEIHVYF